MSVMGGATIGPGGGDMTPHFQTQKGTGGGYNLGIIFLTFSHRGLEDKCKFVAFYCIVIKMLEFEPFLSESIG